MNGQRILTILVATVVATLVPVAPSTATHEQPVVGACDVYIRVDRSLNGYELSMDEAGTCTTSDGLGTITMSGEAEGDPGLTCAGGPARGRASVAFASPGNVETTDVGLMRIANNAGAVTLHVHARNAGEHIVLDGELRQSHTVLSTCLNNATPVFWEGTVVVHAMRDSG